MDMTVTVDVRDAQKKLSAFAEMQLPYAMSLAVNDLAFQLLRAENAQIAATFKHPRPFTQRATQVELKAKKGSPTAIVSVRPAQARYLKPYEFGGVHVLPGQGLLNPKDINLDQYGQLRKNQIKQLLTRPGVFFGTIHGVTGLWQRGSAETLDRNADVVPAKKMKLLVRLGNALPVNKHLHWLDTAEAMLHARWPGAFDAAMKKALDSAKL